MNEEEYDKIKDTEEFKAERARIMGNVVAILLAQRERRKRQESENSDLHSSNARGRGR